MKKILFIVGVHGDEQAPMELFYQRPYGRNDHVEWKVMIANPEAAMANMRFVYGDLNRDAETAENPHIARIQQQIERFKPDVVYDLHTTTNYKPYMPTVCFINNNTEKNRKECRYIQAEYIIWDRQDNKKYVTSLHPVGITLEYPRKDNVEHTRFLIHEDFERIIKQQQSPAVQKLLVADGFISQKEAKKHDLRWEDMKPYEWKNETVFPVFVNYDDPEYYCFLNKEVSDHGE